MTPMITLYKSYYKRRPQFMCVMIIIGTNKNISIKSTADIPLTSLILEMDYVKVLFPYIVKLY